MRLGKAHDCRVEDSERNEVLWIRERVWLPERHPHQFISAHTQFQTLSTAPSAGKMPYVSSFVASFLCFPPKSQDAQPGLSWPSLLPSLPGAWVSTAQGGFHSVLWLHHHHLLLFLSQKVGMNKDLLIVPQDFRFLKNKKREVLDSHANTFTKESKINNSMNRGLEYLTTPSKQPKWSKYTVIQVRCRKLTADYDIIT